MPLTDEQRNIHLGNTENDARALFSEIIEKLDAMPKTPSPEVFAASATVMAAIGVAIVAGTDESNMAMLARVTAAIQEPV